MAEASRKQIESEAAAAKSVDTLPPETLSHPAAAAATAAGAGGVDTDVDGIEGAGGSDENVKGAVPAAPPPGPMMPPGMMPPHVMPGI